MYKRSEYQIIRKRLEEPKAAFIVGDGGISPTDFLTMDIMRLFN